MVTITEWREAAKWLLSAIHVFFSGFLQQSGGFNGGGMTSRGSRVKSLEILSDGGGKFQICRWWSSMVLVSHESQGLSAVDMLEV